MRNCKSKHQTRDENKIKKKLTDYLDFDYSKIINKNIDYAFVFGGAIRDIIAGDKINDIDILCLPESMRKIEKILKNNGYKYSESIGGLDINDMYKDVHCIFQPHNWLKTVGNDIRLVQLIRPSLLSKSRKKIHKTTPIKLLKDNFYYLLKQVDLSCCGVNYSYNFGLKESVSDALIHCKLKVYEEIYGSEMYHNIRIIQRKYKLEQRGWKLLKRDMIKKVLRIKKMKRILVSEK